MCWRLEATLKSIDDPDFSVTLSQVALPALLELWLGIICACMPTLNPLFRTYVASSAGKLKSLALLFAKRSRKSLRDNSHAESGESKGFDPRKDISNFPRPPKPFIQRTVVFGATRGFELDELDEAHQPVLGKNPLCWQR